MARAEDSYRIRTHMLKDLGEKVDNLCEQLGIFREWKLSVRWK